MIKIEEKEKAIEIGKLLWIDEKSYYDYC